MIEVPEHIERLLEDVAGALSRGRTLPARWYTDPRILEAEVAAIFRRSWAPLQVQGSLESAGSYAADVIAGIPIVVVRDGDGLRAFANSCRHRGHPVATGCGVADRLRCHYHGWTYLLDGRLADAPRSEREDGFETDALSLHPVQVASWGPVAFVNPDVNAPGFDESFDELMVTAAARGIAWGGARHRAIETWELKCNWKLFYENVSECYHCPTVHPSFAAEFGVDPQEYELEIRPRFIHHRAPQRGDGTEPVRNWDAFAAWPGWSLSAGHDGRVLFVTSFFPLDVARTQVVTHVYTDDSVHDTAVADELAGWRQVTYEEDGTVCEAVQRNLESGVFSDGPLLLDSEHAICDLQRRLQDALSESLSAARG